MILPQNRKKYDLLPENSPSLLNPSDDVSCEDFEKNSLSEIVLKMAEIAFRENALGIAAPQIGVNKRVILVKLNGIYTVMINPTIMYRGFTKTMSNEGCLSLRNSYSVERHNSIFVQYFVYDNQQFHLRELGLNGLESFTVQHEIDHLNGVLISFIGNKNKDLSNESKTSQ